MIHQFLHQMNRDEGRRTTQLCATMTTTEDERCGFDQKTLFSYNPFYRLPISGKLEMIARG